MCNLPREGTGFNFYPCGHECVCDPCGKKFMQEAKQKICPMCRNRIKDIIKVYR